jgi:hypothetical protein
MESAYKSQEISNGAPAKKNRYDMRTFPDFLKNYLLKITIYIMYSIQGKGYKIFPITNLTKMSTWTKSCTKGKIKIILVKNTRKKNTMPDGELVLQ